MVGIREGHIQRIALGVEVDGLPRAGLRHWQTRGDTAAKAEADAGHQNKIEERGKQLLHWLQRWSQRSE